MHYRRWLRFGGVGPAGGLGKRASLADRFNNRVQQQLSPPYCLVWTGTVHKASGFGVIWKGHRLLYAHRIGYELAHGPIPLGGKVVQVCRNRLCVRDDHLELQ